MSDAQMIFLNAGALVVLALAVGSVIESVIDRRKKRKAYVQQLERKTRELQLQIARLNSESKFLKFELETKGKV